MMIRHHPPPPPPRDAGRMGLTSVLLRLLPTTGQQEAQNNFLLGGEDSASPKMLTLSFLNNNAKTLPGQASYALT